MTLPRLLISCYLLFLSPTVHMLRFLGGDGITVSSNMIRFSDSMRSATTIVTNRPFTITEGEKKRSFTVALPGKHDI